MNATSPLQLYARARALCLLAVASAGLLLPSAAVAAGESDALPSFAENYVSLSAAGMDVQGSGAAAQARTQIPASGAIGIAAFNVARDLTKTTSIAVDGQALPGAEKYLLHVNLTKSEFGSLDAGYKTFRTFYDGAGGFFPLNRAWFPIYPREMHVDRGEFRLGGTLNLPAAPVFTLQFTHRTRTGRKDSTIWGDSDLTGLPIYSLSALNLVSSDRKIIPAYLDLDEKSDTLELSARHTFGKTTAFLSVVGTRIDNLDSRSVDRYVGELRPFPAIPSNPVTLVPAAFANNPNRGFDVQGTKQDEWTVTAKVETEITAKITAYAGASYRSSDADVTGSRLITLTLNSSRGVLTGIGGFTSAGRPPYSYLMAGTVKAHLYSANAGVNLKPAKDLAVDLGVKAEDSDVIAHNTTTYISTFMNQATGLVAAPQLSVAPNRSRLQEKVWAPEVNVRYTGLKRLTLYGSADYRSSPGDERRLDTQINPGPTGSNYVVSVVEQRLQTDKGRYLNAKVGAVWSPGPLVNVRAELFTKAHENRFDGYGVSTGGLYILDYNHYGARITATVRPLPTWSFTTRYIGQFGQAAVTTDFAPTGDSMDARRHSLSETATWTPNKLFFAQGSVNVVYDSIRTGYPTVGGAANDVLRNADNNYWNGNVLAGFVVDKRTNAQIEASCYDANNYQPARAVATLPYGASGREYALSLGLTRKLSDRWVTSAKLGYFESRNDTLGGNADFHGPLAYVSVQHAL